MTNTGPTGSLNVDKFQRAMLIYRNSVDPETKTSPAMVLFGRPVRDPIPILLGRYCPHNTWQETMENREIALAKRHSREHEKWSLHTRQLPPLKVGDHVYLQNLVGNHPRRWDRTGVVVEVRQFHQYAIRVDGSGRVTLRNRQHLRRFRPFQPTTDRINTVPHIPPSAGESGGPPTTMTPQPTPTRAPVSLPSPPGNTPDTTTEPAAAYTTPSRPSTPVHLGNDDSAPPLPQTAPAASVGKLPLALRRLLPHNKAGIKESVPAARRSHV